MNKYKSVIQQEIEWSEFNIKESGHTEEWNQGFISGLRQAELLIIKVDNAIEKIRRDNL